VLLDLLIKGDPPCIPLKQEDFEFVGGAVDRLKPPILLAGSGVLSDMKGLDRWCFDDREDLVELADVED
jgi:hypothetical protein